MPDYITLIDCYAAPAMDFPANLSYEKHIYNRGKRNDFYMEKLTMFRRKTNLNPFE